MKIIVIGSKKFRVHRDTCSMMFKELSDEEEESYRFWAKENPSNDPSPIHHPAVQDEHYKMIDK